MMKDVNNSGATLYGLSLRQAFVLSIRRHG